MVVSDSLPSPLSSDFVDSETSSPLLPVTSKGSDELQMGLRIRRFTACDKLSSLVAKGSSCSRRRDDFGEEEQGESEQ